MVQKPFLASHGVGICEEEWVWTFTCGTYFYNFL